MKKLLLLSALFIFTCTDDEGNPCVYEPTLTTEAATDITETSATLNGVISIVSENCDVPNNAEQGFVYSTEIQPTLADIQVNVNGTNISTTIEGLTPNTTYYVRAFLTNNLGEFYGNEVSFSTEEEPTTGGCDVDEAGTVIGQDGNIYDYLCYGGQVWTVDNAEMVTYRDGTPIPQVTDLSEWTKQSTGAWAYYNNDPTKPRLYNWYAVAGIHDTDPNTPNKEFAPKGWHVPSDAEWTTLEEYLIASGYNYDGTTTGNRIAKAMASTTGWISSTEIGAIGNDQSLNNDSDFNAFPEGNRVNGGSFYDEGYLAVFWSSTEFTTTNAWGRDMVSNYSSLYRRHYGKMAGFSVRFVRD